MMVMEEILGGGGDRRCEMYENSVSNDGEV